MLYYLFEYLKTLEVPGMGAFTYVTTRAGLAFILSMLIATIVGRRIIDKLQLKQIGETIRDLGLEGQISKKGTPTMGGSSSSSPCSSPACCSVNSATSTSSS
ncbi:Phospho-N-acetylmuramoyl-pentapeptide-transferase [Porphyromonas cangingivalis]|nr:Phospho-N-acetylmuramoyl-pentapeptide-transferase [Porphyromonas cangingivalis]